MPPGLTKRAAVRHPSALPGPVATPARTSSLAASATAIAVKALRAGSSASELVPEHPDTNTARNSAPGNRDAIVWRFIDDASGWSRAPSHIAAHTGLTMRRRIVVPPG